MNNTKIAPKKQRQRRQRIQYTDSAALLSPEGVICFDEVEMYERVMMWHMLEPKDEESRRLLRESMRKRAKELGANIVVEKIARSYNYLLSFEPKQQGVKIVGADRPKQ